MGGEPAIIRINMQVSVTCNAIVYKQEAIIFRNSTLSNIDRNDLL